MTVLAAKDSGRFYSDRVAVNVTTTPPTEAVSDAKEGTSGAFSPLSLSLSSKNIPIARLLLLNVESMV